MMLRNQPAAHEPDPGRSEADRLRHDLRAGQADGVCYSLMVGAGESFLPAFVLALGMGEVASGLIVAAPPIVGAVLQSASPAGVRALRSQRRWVMGCVMVQALSFVPLIAAALNGGIPAAALFLVASVYWGSGQAAGSAWNAWMGRIIPPPIRPRYFARRSRWMQFAQLLGLAGAGAALQAGERAGRALDVFAVLFLIAGCCRFLSARMLARQSEPPLPVNEQRSVRLTELVARFRHGRDARLLLYLAALQVGLQMSTPYFAPYALSELKFGYVHYMGLVAASFAAKVVVYPALGRLVHRGGAGRLLWIAGVGMPLLPLAWMLSTGYGWLLCTQLMVGTVWAAFELAQLLLFFEAIPAEERTSVLTTFNLANSLAMLVGSLLGGAMLKALGQGHSAYLTVFGVSALVRAMAGLAWIKFARGLPPRPAML